MAYSMFALGYVAIWALVLFQSLIILALVKEVRQLRQLTAPTPGAGSILNDRLPEGSRAPQFSGVNLITGDILDKVIQHGLRTVVLFLSPTCGNCRRIAYDLRAFVAGDQSSVVMVCAASDDRQCAKLVRQLQENVMIRVLRSESAARSYRVSGFPTAVVVDEHGRVEKYIYPQLANEIVAAANVATTLEAPEELFIGREEMAR